MTHQEKHEKAMGEIREIVGLWQQGKVTHESAMATVADILKKYR